MARVDLELLNLIGAETINLRATRVTQGVRWVIRPPETIVGSIRHHCQAEVPDPSRLDLEYVVAGTPDVILTFEYTLDDGCGSTSYDSTSSDYRVDSTCSASGRSRFRLCVAFRRR